MNNPADPALSKAGGSAGFTLVELAVCLCILGILASSGLMGGAVYFKVEKARETRRKVMGALMYPMMLIIFAITAVTVMLWMVVPTF